jgi:hypothetical protein
VCFDNTRQRTFYYNVKTKESKWTLPEDVEPKPAASTDASEVDFSDDEGLDLPS